MVTEWATQRRRAETMPDGRPRKCLSACAIARMMTLRRDHLTRDEALTVARIADCVPRLAEVAALVDDFQRMIRNRTPDHPDTWLRKADQSLLSSFARGPRTDRAAIVAAMEQPWPRRPTPSSACAASCWTSPCGESWWRRTRAMNRRRNC